MSVAEYPLAVNFINKGPKPSTPTSNEESLIFYKYFKQASEGDCNTPQPGMLELTQKAKWSAWNSVKGMTKEDAKIHYVKTLDSTRPQWKQEAQAAGITA